MGKWAEALLQLDDVMRSAVVLCASRLDANVSASDFVDALDSLLERTYEAGYRAGTEAADEAPPNLPPLRFPTRKEAVADASSEATDEDKEGEDKAVPRSPSAKKRRRGLSHDDKVRVRARYDEALVGRQRAPYGFVEGLAAEYGVSEWTIWNAVRGGDG